jgi:tetratricopeptide (TPR) repeat protein
MRLSLALRGSAAACLLAIAASAVGVSARAGTPDEDACLGWPGIDLNQEVVACTTIINSGTSAKLDWAYFDRANTYGRLAQFDKAFPDYEAASRITPNYPGLYVNRGWAYSRIGKYDLAIQDFDRTIRDQPDFAAMAYTQRGIVHNKLGQTDRAVADFEAALRLKPGYELAQTNLDRIRAAQASAPK